MDVESVIDTLERHARRLAQTSATYKRSVRSEGRIHTLGVVPVNPRARAIWVTGQQWLGVSVGEIGGAWEFDYTDDAIREAQQIIEAVIAGRVVERISLGRSEVTVALNDGVEVTEGGYVAPWGFLPMPGWTRRARVIAYESYGV